MAKADLRIVLDKPDARYVGGETIRGNVHVRVDSDCRCKELKVERLWRTHGRGNQDSGGQQRLTLFSGDWRAGDEQAYAFEFIADAFPVSYHGHYVNIDWYIVARADVPWAIDPKAETEFLVEPAAVVEAPSVFFPSEEESKAKSSAGPAGCLLTIALALLFFGFISLPIGAIFMAVGIGFAVMGLRNIIAERRLGAVTIAVEPKLPVPGQDVKVKVSFQPRMMLSLNRASAILTGDEKVVSGSGTKKKTYTHSIESMHATLSEATRLGAGTPVTFETQFQLPADAPFSFKASSNDILWQIAISFDIERWPDWNNTVTLRVLPSAEAGLLTRRDWEDDGDEDEDEFDDEFDDDDELDADDELDEDTAAPRDADAGVPVSEVAKGPHGISPVREPSFATASSTAAPAARVAAHAPPAATAPTVDDRAPSIATEKPDSELADLLRRIAKTPAYDDARPRLLAEARDRVWSLSLEVDRVSWTSGIDVPPAMQGGRTLVGKAAGIEPLLNVRFPQSINSEIDGLRQGNRKDLNARLTGWDSLYDRPVFDAAD